MRKETHDEGLARAFRAASLDAVGTNGCPDAETLAAGVAGALPPAQVAALAEHLAGCGACAEDWRVAKHLHEAAVSEGVAPAPRAPTQTARVVAFPLRRLMAPLALAAAVLAAVLLLPDRQTPDPTPILRNGSAEQLVISDVPRETALPREACTLRWRLEEPVPGARYTVQVTTQDLFTVVARAEDLTEPTYTVPAEQLRALAPGTRLLWWVDVTYPDGHAVRSSTFTHLLADP